MKIVIFGASGMVGQGVLRECLEDASTHQVVIVVRSALTIQHPKLQQIISENLFELDMHQNNLQGVDACFFCLGVSSAGMTQEQYQRMTYDLTLSVASKLAQSKPAMRFIYVSGIGTDSTERGSSMWARVKGATENALLRLPFKAAYMFRPGLIIPLHGVQSKTRSYRLLYLLLTPLLRVLYRFRPGSMTTTVNMGQAMLQLARADWPDHVLDGKAINRAAQLYTQQ